MYLLKVPTTRTVLVEGLAAVVARERFLPRVYPHVDAQRPTHTERLAAVGADVRSLPGVYLHVHLEVRSAAQDLPAQVARARPVVVAPRAALGPRPRPRVLLAEARPLLLVEGQVAPLGESLAAHLARVRPLAGVDPTVVDQVGPGSERPATLAAHVPLHPRVHRHVLPEGLLVAEHAAALLAGEALLQVDGPVPLQAQSRGEQLAAVFAQPLLLNPFG